MVFFVSRQLYKNRQILKFIISGGTTALFGLTVLYVLTDFFGLWYLLSAVLAFIVGFFISFSLQKLWTFKDKRQDQVYRQLSLYLSVALTNLVLNTALMYLFVDVFGVWYMLAQVIVDLVIAAESFLMYKFIVFKKEETMEAANYKNNTRKILIATGIYPPDVGGPATLLSGLPKALRERGFEVKVITYSDVLPSPEERASGLVFRILRRQSSFSRYAKYFWRMWWLAHWADLVYATDLYSVGSFARLIKKLTGKKYILRFAGDSAWETAVAKGWTEDYIVDFQDKKYNQKIEDLKNKRKKILVEADKVIAVSNFLASVARQIGVASGNIEVIYNAVDFFSDLPLYQESARPTLVYSGRLVPWKGVAMIISMVAKLKIKQPDIMLEILGDGSERDSLEKLVDRLGLAENVNFHGRVSEQKTHQVFARATLFVLNTNYEGLPYSVLNAMQVGVPVITTPVGGNPEVVEHGVSGWLVPYNNKLAWQEAIERLLSDRLLREKLSQNAKKNLAKFRFAEMVEKTVGVIKSLK